MSKKSFSIISLGCFRNSYDSQVVAEEFLDKGYVFKDKFNKCDTLIVNTCGFIDKAKEESAGIIAEAVDLKKKKKVKKLIVFGCLVKRYADELKKFFPQVDEWRSIVEFNNFLPKRVKGVNLSPSCIGFLKICEGCLNKCSFCAIPFMKGSLLSRSQSQVVKEAKYLDEKGVKELNIIGQDITSWGKDFKPKENLTTLIKNILKEAKNIKWFRLIYTHPRHFTNSLIELIAKDERICKYIDLPIQHINDRILKAMNRNTPKRQLIGLISKIRKKIPHCAIRTSVIVGFPGETKEEFKELLSFLKYVQFDKLGAFMYSKEENTPAYKLNGHIHHSTKKSRFNEVMSMQKQIASKLNNRFIGEELEVLIEGKNKGVFTGRTQYDAPEVDGCVFIKKKALNIGDLCKAKIIDACDYDLIAV